MMKLAEKCVAHDMEIVSSEGFSAPAKYNIEITSSVIEHVMSEEAKKSSNSSTMNGANSFIPPFFDNNYLDNSISDLAPISSD